jgi:hypothetical protein
MLQDPSERPVAEIVAFVSRYEDLHRERMRRAQEETMNDEKQDTVWEAVKKALTTYAKVLGRIFG